MGVQLINRDSTSEIDVMLSASAACTAARELGRNRIQYQHLSQDSLRRHKLSKWTARISEALEEDRFVVYCQPIVPIRGQGDTRHYEALVRMLDPEGNLVPPGKFIPAAESSGLIDDIDRWVFDKVLSVLEALPPEKQQLYTFSINLSGPTVCDEKFREHVIERVRNSVLVPKAIHFEITETAAVKHFDRAVGFIRALKELGCAFSLDDFGSGLSSFGYLKQLPVDYLKIDGSFVRKMEAGDVEFSMVSTINHLAHVMGLKTIAECVENKAQLSLLEEMGVDFVQGYAISAPVPMETVL
jgi:EAL domain-containing protein (putative c-di-GMP-specific phosphodiesterase class I)